MTKTRLASTRASAAWAAWGDALGFITELTDASGLVHRAGLEHVTEPVPWRRRVGGRVGVNAALPAGAYSDDTQLRLATCRAIRDDGEFDVDSFARVELVAWQAYHLGAGRGSKAAAAGMTRSEARWSQNMFATKDSRYVEVGGNGAAMRIQPHVWSAPDLSDPTRVLPGVVRNAVCTHGHPVGILGAAFHAVCLMATMDHGTVPGPGQWHRLTSMASTVLDIVGGDDEDLAGLWRPAWELAAGRPLMPALHQALQDLDDLLARVAAALPGRGSDPAGQYLSILDIVGGLDPATRGSGIGTAVAALALAATADDPAGALRLAANTLGSDTDTIATMAGALMGAVIADHPPSSFQDVKYIDREAYRMHAVATGAGSSLPAFRYPDLFDWSPPRSSLDLVGTTTGGRLVLAGLGDLTEVGPPSPGGGSRTPTIYEWMELPFGQQVFVRYRPDPKPLHAGLEPGRHVQPVQAVSPPRQEELLPVDVAAKPPSPTMTLDDALAAARADNYDPHHLGTLLLRLIEEDPATAVARSAAFAAALATDLKRR